jgi:ABC-type glycerol-3-phosphate transport system substrate-binding protein
MPTIRIKTWHHGNCRPKFDAMIEEYSALNPGVRIVQEEGRKGLRFHDGIRQDIVEGTVSDMFYMAGGSIAAPFIDSGDVLQLDKEYTSRRWESILDPVAKSMIMRHGHVWGVPRSACQMAWVYRNDIFERLAIEPPRTYDQLVENNRKLRGAEITPLAFGFKDAGYAIMRFFDFLIECCAGPQLHDELNGLRASWACPAIVRALALAREWNESGWLLPRFESLPAAGAKDELYRGRAAMMIETESFEMLAVDAGQDPSLYGVFPAPGEIALYRSYLYPHQIMVWSGSPHRAEAIRFLDWYIQPQQQKRHYQALEGTATLGVTPPRAGSWKLTEEFRQIGRDRSEYYFPSDEVFDNEREMPVYFDALRSVLFHGVEPEEAARSLDKTFREARARAG